jgi:hypothetical protein
MNEREQAIIDLLWDSLKRDPEHKDRRQTGWGTKTKTGLIACIERIHNSSDLPRKGDLNGLPRSHADTTSA